MESSLKLENVTKRYDDFVLNNVSLELPAVPPEATLKTLLYISPLVLVAVLGASVSAATRLYAAKEL